MPLTGRVRQPVQLLEDRHELLAAVLAAQDPSRQVAPAINDRLGFYLEKLRLKEGGGGRFSA